MVDGNGLELLDFCHKGKLNIPLIVFHGGSIGTEIFYQTSTDCIAVLLKPDHISLKETIKESL